MYKIEFKKINHIDSLEQNAGTILNAGNYAASLTKDMVAKSGYTKLNTLRSNFIVSKIRSVVAEKKGTWYVYELKVSIQVTLCITKLDKK